MALAIILGSRDDVPHWEDAEAVMFGLVDSLSWEQLFFKDLDVQTFLEYCAEGKLADRYNDYYADRISQIASKYPLIVRAKDYYRDAFFSAYEIPELVKELAGLKAEAHESQSVDFINQMLEASTVALDKGASIRLSAD